MEWILSNGASLLAGVVVVLTGLISISLLIPGEQPEKALQKVLDVLTKLSR